MRDSPEMEIWAIESPKIGVSYWPSYSYFFAPVNSMSIISRILIERVIRSRKAYRGIYLSTKYLIRVFFWLSCMF